MLTKVQGCLLGVMLGDALGLPVEKWSSQRILEQTKGNGVSGFVDYMFTWPKDRFFSIGDTSDDWQLTLAVTKSLINSHGWDKQECLRQHVLAYLDSTFGWGRSTYDSIRDFIDKKRAINEFPTSFPKGTGCGNGVMMKIAPIALFYAIRDEHLDEKHLFDVCMSLGSMTHPDPRAWICAFVVNYMIASLLHSSVKSLDDGLCLLERTIGFVAFLSQSMEIQEDNVLGRLIQVFDNIDDGDEPFSGLQTSCFALDSVALTVAIFLHYFDDFRGGVLEAINFGGDTDTNASIVGALIGANCGVDSIPLEWRCFRSEYQTPMILGHQLYNVAKNK